MRTTSYRSVLDGVLRLARIEPAMAQREDVAQLAEFIAERLSAARESYLWPEDLLLEERTLRAPYDAAATYADGAEIYFEYDETCYEALEAIAAGESPATAPLKWLALDSWPRVLDWAPAWQSEPLGTVVHVWTEDPRLNEAAPELDFKELREGVLLPPKAPAAVWVQHRPADLEWAGWTEWSATTTYAAGAVMYFTDGELYRALSTTTAGQSPATHPTLWAVHPFPERLAKPVKRGAYGDWLLSTGQDEKAGAQEAAFWAALDEQAAILTKQQGQQTGTYRRR